MKRPRSKRVGTFDPLLLCFALTMVAATFSQTVPGPVGSQSPASTPSFQFLPPLMAASPSIAQTNSPPASRTVPQAAPQLSPSVSTSHGTFLSPPSAPVGSAERSPKASLSSLAPSPSNKRPSGAPSHPIPHRPVTPPSHPSTIPGWPFSRPPPIPSSSSDSLPPDTKDGLPPPPPLMPPLTPFPALSPSLDSAGLTPAAFTPTDDPPRGRSVLSGGEVAGIVIGGLLTGALVATAMFVASKQKENIARAQCGHGLYREQL